MLLFFTQGLSGRNYIEYDLMLSVKAVQTLSACNEEGSPLKNYSFDPSFVRLMVIALFGSEELTANVYPPQKRDFMERLFDIRVGEQADRKAKFNEYFETALKEAIFRNSKNKKKLEQIKLPHDVFNRKRK